MPEGSSSLPFGPMPSHWRRAPVRDVGEVRLGRAHFTVKSPGEDTAAFVSPQALHDGRVHAQGLQHMQITPATRRKYTIRTGDILVCVLQNREQLGRSALYDGPDDALVFQNGLLNLRCRDGVLPSFAQLVFERWFAHRHLLPLARRTTTLAHVGLDSLLNLEFPIPPIGEQRRISDVFTDFNNAILHTEKLVRKLVAVLHDLREDLTGQGLTHDTRLPPEKLTASQLRCDRRTWRRLRLAELCSPDAPILYGIHQPPSEVVGGVPVLQGRDLVDGTLDTTRVHRICPEQHRRHPRSQLQGGELLLTLVGIVGRVAQFPTGIGPANIHRVLARVKVSPEHDARFVLHCLRSEAAQRQIIRATTGSSQALLTIATVRDLQLDMPPLEDQRAISAQLDALERQLQAEECVAEKLKAMKIAVADDLLTGRVSVQR